MDTSLVLSFESKEVGRISIERVAMETASGQQFLLALDPFQELEHFVLVKSLKKVKKLDHWLWQARFDAQHWYSRIW